MSETISLSALKGFAQKRKKEVDSEIQRRSKQTYEVVLEVLHVAIAELVRMILDTTSSRFQLSKKFQLMKLME